jgi:hypothetical protein
MCSFALMDVITNLHNLSLLEWMTVVGDVTRMTFMCQKMVIIIFLVDGDTQIFLGDWKSCASLLLSGWNLTQSIAVLCFTLGRQKLECVEQIYASVYKSANRAGSAFTLITRLQCHSEVTLTFLGVSWFAHCDSAVGSELMACRLYAGHDHWVKRM